MFNKPIVLSRDWLRKVLREGQILEPTAIISISASQGYLLNIREQGNIKGLLQMVYADITSQVDGFRYVLFNAYMAKQVVDFVNRMKDEVDILICQCDAGISRSAGTAAAIAKYFFGDDDFYFKKYYPNTLVYSLILNEFHDREEAINE